VIAAFHGYTGNDEGLTLASERIARQLDGAAPATARAWLLASDRGLLGSRALVRPYREGVQWNPADERCPAGGLLLQGDSARWALSGELFAA
jgi:hypothetical protein